MAESSVNLLIMLAGIMIPIVRPGNLTGNTGTSAGISGDHLVNFLLSGGTLLAIFYSTQEALRKAPLGE